YLPHYTGSRQIPQNYCAVLELSTFHTSAHSFPVTSVNCFVFILLYLFFQSFPTQGFIKYSIPQPPGRQSVEVYYPYDFAQQRIITNMPPMANVPQSPNIPRFDMNPIPSQDPLNQAQRDQPALTSQVDYYAHHTHLKAGFGKCAKCLIFVCPQAPLKA
uniref:Uncharacterized protein n=1 Tax=Neogobius melanostomus TaxID=47308 RepID=A0A8C6T2Y9_9GOBI